MESPTTCHACGKEISKQSLLPYIPMQLPSELRVYGGASYHRSCIDDKLNSGDLKQNPNLNLDLKLRASEAFAISNMLSGIEAAGTTEQMAITKLRRLLNQGLAEKNHLYTPCMNAEHCETKIVRAADAYEGVETMKVWAQHKSKPKEIDKAHKHGEVRKVALFCSSRCDINFASRAKLAAEALAVEEQKKAEAKRQKTAKAKSSGTLELMAKQAAAAGPAATAAVNELLKLAGWSDENIKNLFSRAMPVDVPEPPKPPYPPVQKDDTDRPVPRQPNGAINLTDLCQNGDIHEDAQGLSKPEREAEDSSNESE